MTDLDIILENIETIMATGKVKEVVISKVRIPDARRVRNTGLYIKIEYEEE